MNRKNNKNDISNNKKIMVRVRFITIMQRYSGQKEIRMELLPNPFQAVKYIIDKFQIPWSGQLEKSTRIFINKKELNDFLRSGELLKPGDTIAFIPISGGG